MKVLFVCTGNACRSPVAEALLKKFNSEVDVDSAGTHAYHKIIEVTENYLKQQKAEKYLKNCPDDLENKDLIEYDLIIAMEKKHKTIILRQCPECFNKIVVWNIDDPYNLPEEYAEIIFNQIRHKVKEFANSI